MLNELGDITEARIMELEVGVGGVFSRMKYHGCATAAD